MARADSLSYPLLANASATGPQVLIRGGIYCLTVNGTLTGATLQLQMLQPDGVTWSPVSDVSVPATPLQVTSAPGTLTRIYLPAGSVRLALTAGTIASTNAWLVGIG